jgi:hypothetical protein
VTVARVRNEETVMDLRDLLPKAERVEVTPSPAVDKQAVRAQLIYSVSGLVLGLVCLLGGVVLFLRGVTGSASWTGKVLGLESRLTDASPGVVLFVVGLFVVWVTRFDVRTRK